MNGTNLLAATFRCGRTRSGQILATVLAAWLLVAQIATAVHRIDHQGTPQSTRCELCIAADHLSAPPSVELRHEPPAFDEQPPIVDEREPAHAGTNLPYRSRAPPRYA